MYTSKYYTCEQIDERLLQGYYDDAVAHGFTGNKAEFWTLVLSISQLKDDIHDICEQILRMVQDHDNGISNLQSKIVNLENSIRSISNQLNTAMNLIDNINTQLAKIQPLTEEEVSTLVNDALES
jgi:peptidoglycan hydrolase CwlO-like protein